MRIKEQMMNLKKSGIAAAIVVLSVASTMSAWACPANVAKPFTSGPLDALGMFSTYVVDSNGVGLTTCTDSVDGLGNPPPCFYDPIVPTNALSVALGRGTEAFVFLANSVFTTVGAAPVDAVIVMGVETAFLSAEPTAGFQTQFQRLRTRLNVNAVGIYTVETPWGIKSYTVDKLLKPGNGQNRAEVSDPIDITFAASSSVPGLVTPFLIANNRGSANPALYIGDGLTPTTVTSSPCSNNFVRITAVGLDGVTPININNGSNVYTEPLFTVMGKKAAVAAVPLSISSAYYTRKASATTVTVMADGSASASAVSTLTVGTTTVPMVRDGSRFYGVTPASGTLPTDVSVTSTDTLVPSTPNTLTASLKDLVTISSAVAQCSGVGPLKSCVLSVNATSSDDGSGGTVPTLTLMHNNTPLVNGAVSTVSAAIPAAVTVQSSAGGASVRPVTVINQ
jgi:hypothetical protein